MENEPALVLILLHMRIIEACFNAHLDPVKNCKKGVITIFNFKVCPPPPLKQQILYAVMYIVNLNNICNWEAGSRGGGHT